MSDEVLKTQYSTVYLNKDKDKEVYQEFLEYLNNHFDSRLEELLIFFNIQDFSQYGLEVYIYSTQEAYNDYVISSQGLPSDYSKCSFEEKRVNVVIPEKNLLKLSCAHFLNNIIHECVHLLYYVYYQLKDEHKRIVWFDEGLAYNLSGEMDDCRDFSKFKKFYHRNIVNKHLEIPKSEYLLKHGTKYGEFVDQETYKYDGYNVSYVVVRYLLEVLPQEKFFNLLGNFEELLSKSAKYLEEALRYFDNLFPVKERIEDIENAEELMDYMNKFLAFGYHDLNGKVHINTLDKFIELYRVPDINSIIKTGYGTCIEFNQFAYHVLKNMGLDAKIFILRDINHIDTYRFTFILAFNKDGEWYIFDYNNSQKQEIRKVADLDKYNQEFKDNMGKSIPESSIELIEFTEIPSGLSYMEFHEYLSQKNSAF